MVAVFFGWGLFGRLRRLVLWAVAFVGVRIGGLFGRWVIVCSLPLLFVRRLIVRMGRIVVLGHAVCVNLTGLTEHGMFESVLQLRVT